MNHAQRLLCITALAIAATAGATNSQTDPGSEQIPWSANEVASRCSAALDQFCRGYIVGVTLMLLDNCRKARKLEMVTGFLEAAPPPETPPLQVYAEFLGSMNRKEFAETFGELPAHFGISKAAADRWPCKVE